MNDSQPSPRGKCFFIEVTYSRIFELNEAVSTDNTRIWLPLFLLSHGDIGTLPGYLFHLRTNNWSVCACVCGGGGVGGIFLLVKSLSHLV